MDDPSFSFETRGKMKMDSYISKAHAVETVKTFKLYLEKMVDNTKRSQSKDKKTKLKKKPLPLEPADDELTHIGITATSKVLLQIDLKKIPLNKTTYINRIPVPHHWYEVANLDICLIVKDLNPKEPLKDRELDLNSTKDFYREKLINCGLKQELIDRINILPMRELITEFKENEAKNKLAKSYDIFLADRSLMNNKFKFLNTFLGKHFWIKEKKMPVPLRLKGSDNDSLKNDIMNALSETSLYISGKGSSISVQFGVIKQCINDIADNLDTVLKFVHNLFHSNVATLRIKGPNTLAIPFFADFGLKREIDVKKACPGSDKIKMVPEVGEFSLLNQADVVVYPSGAVKVVAKDDFNSDEESDHEIRKIEKQLIDHDNVLKNPKRHRKNILPPQKKQKIEVDIPVN